MTLEEFYYEQEAKTDPEYLENHPVEFEQKVIYDFISLRGMEREADRLFAEAMGYRKEDFV